jgi:hypothetical protein
MKNWYIEKVLMKSKLSILTSILLIASPSVLAQYSCDASLSQVAKELTRPKEVLDQWAAKSFTQAKDFDPNKKYMFLTHSLTGGRGAELIQNPEGIADNPYISSSLVNEEVGATYGTFGLILRPSAQHVFATHWTDMAVGLMPEHSTELVLGHLGRQDLISPSEVLKNTGKFRSPEAGGTLNYNEVILGGRSFRGHKIKVDGFFISIKADGSLFITEERHNEIKASAERHKLPIVYLPHREFVTEEGHRESDQDDIGMEDLFDFIYLDGP